MSRYHKQIRTGSLAILLLVVAAASTAEPLILNARDVDFTAENLAMNFNSDRTSLNALPTTDSFTRQRFSDNLRVRGWRVADDLYFGQAKVADKWGIGLLLKKDKVVYGLNHRGVQITRQF